jgi:hypothetical protein
MRGRGDLPGVLADIAAVAGEDAALTIAAARGGTQIYMPPAPEKDHWLSCLVGHRSALAIADRLTCGVGSMRIDLPLGPKGAAAKLRAKVDRLLEEGELSERDIARATGYTARGVRMRAARMRTGEREDPQLKLI